MKVMDNSVDAERWVENGTLAEQPDETYYDNREDADDDVEKGRIKFPKHKLYGRDSELNELFEMYSSMNSENSSSRVVFLSGYSGTGKSALIDEFVKQISTQPSNDKQKRIRYISGKFDPLNAGEPLKAISQALNQYVVKLSQGGASRGELKPVKLRLARAGIYFESELADVLKATLVPDLDRILLKKIDRQARLRGGESSDEEEDPRRPNHIPSKHSTVGLSIHSSVSTLTTNSATLDIKAIMYALQMFFRALATENDAVLFFMDDLQWAGDACLRLLHGLLTYKELKHTMIIGAYQTNEVGDNHELKRIMKHVDHLKGPDLSRQIDISNLSPDSVAQFIADSIKMTAQEVAPIADAVYSKTLGNIFFVQQAMEELVRKNAIFYDVVCFQWKFGDVNGVELEKFLSDDVVDMVSSKLRALPDTLQKCLALAAYTNDTIDIDLLLALVEAESLPLGLRTLQKLMQLAFAQGLLLETWDASANQRYYKFSHNSIQEAARAAIPPGDERHRLLLRISKVLMDYGTPEENDWMLFTAARHLNAIPPRMRDSIQLAHLNLAVGKMASCQGAFHEASDFLRAGIACLDPKKCWNQYYTLCLDLKSSLAQAEHALAHEREVLEICEEVFANAKSLVEKNRAYFCYIEALEATNNSHSVNCDKTLDILALYGINVPKSPTAVNVKVEKFRLRLALGNRDQSCMAQFPITADPTLVAQFKVAEMALSYSIHAGRNLLTEMLGKRMKRVVLDNQVITKDLPLIFIRVGVHLRRREKYRRALGFASVAISLMDRFPEERGLEFLRAKFALYSSLASLRLPFRSTVETNLDLSKLLVAKGETMYSVASGIVGMYGYLNASFRLDKTYESKLKVLDVLATSLGQKQFSVVFKLLRQFLHNLQGGNKAGRTPVMLKGALYDEDQVQVELEGESRNMNRRDNAVVRLMLAVIFDDEAKMQKMLDVLDEFPTFDLILEREHIRMVFVGFAAAILSRKSGKRRQLVNDMLRYFTDLSGFGCPNAHPVCACMKALEKPSVSSFEEAIRACGKQRMLHFAALMHERCGLMLLDQGMVEEENAGKVYLISAIWLYHDWGALRKVQQLQERHEFLHLTLKEQVPRHLKSMRKLFADKPLISTIQDELLGDAASASG